MNSSVRMKTDEPASLAASRTAGEEEEEKEDSSVGAVPVVSEPVAVAGDGKKKPACARTSKRSERCEAAGDIRVDGNASTIYADALDREWKTKPYAWYHDPAAMIHVREFTLKPFPSSAGAPACTKNHSVLGFIFSNGGFSGNLGLNASGAF